MKRTRSQASLPTETSKLDTASWYDSHKWLDLTIRLSNGRGIHVHKMVLCSRNEHFNKLCGLESRFAESEQSEIELKEDSPDVLEGVLRYIYGCETEDCHQQPWHYWLELVGYLEPRWSEDAADRFEMSALSLQKVDVEEICDVLETLQDTEKYELFESFAVDLTLRHLYLLDDERFRALVYNCKQIMFKLVERLSFAADLVPVKLFYEHHGEMEVYLKRCNGNCSNKQRAGSVDWGAP